MYCACWFACCVHLLSDYRLEDGLQVPVVVRRPVRCLSGGMGVGCTDLVSDERQS